MRWPWRKKAVSQMEPWRMPSSFMKYAIIHLRGSCRARMAAVQASDFAQPMQQVSRQGPRLPSSTFKCGSLNTMLAAHHWRIPKQQSLPQLHSQVRLTCNPPLGASTSTPVNAASKRGASALTRPKYQMIDQIQATTT